jgi:GNAT superfamily N-acetyltransferase
VTALTATTLNQIDHYWATFFGCPYAQLRSKQTFVGPHVGQGDYHGFFALAHDDGVLISVPPALLNVLRPQLEHLTAEAVLDQQHLDALLGDTVERMIGPAFVGYADVQTFQPAHKATARLLSVYDTAALERLKAACGATAWEHGGSEIGEHPVAGAEVNGELVAVAGYEVWGEQIAHIAVVSHPAYRGGGYGRAVVSRVAGEALRRGLIAQYRTLTTNTPSMTIARALGFVPYAHSMAVRFKQQT